MRHESLRWDLDEGAVYPPLIVKDRLVAALERICAEFEQFRWVPDDPNANFNAFKPREFRNLVVFPVLGSSNNAPRRFGVADLYFYTQEVNPNTGRVGDGVRLSKDTGKDVDRIKAVKERLLKQPAFQKSHPFPWYIRMGYNDLDEFMNGWDWQFDYDKKAKILWFNPRRIEYRMLQPIINQAKKTLVINYYTYPTSKIPKRFRGRLPVILLNVADPFYFGWVVPRITCWRISAVGAKGWRDTTRAILSGMY